MMHVVAFDDADGLTTMLVMSTVALVLSLGAAAHLPSYPTSVAPSEQSEPVGGERTGIG
jgi:hypothetical protein